jgi:glyoxylase-like metal-dependent hydrolase (beta-lactamase superfamily II)
MDNVERIADDLYFIKYVHREGTFVGITVILGQYTIGLVDTGFERTIVGNLFTFLREMGRSPEEIAFVVNTHRDGDHIQGNHVLKEKTKAKIAVHELDADAVEGVDVKLHDGDRVELGDRTFEVIHAPGHTPGNICLYQTEEKLLIVGDTLCGDRINLIRMDKDLYINSIKRLLDLDVNLLIQSHPRKPLEKGVLVSEEPRQMMLASISLAEQSQ